jgi:multidrug efflux system membrane fusion protein
MKHNDTAGLVLCYETGKIVLNPRQGVPRVFWGLGLAMLRRQVKFGFLGTLAVLLLAGTASAQAPAGGPGAAPRTVPVMFGKAERKAMPVRFDTIGSVQAISTVTLRSRVESQVVEVAIADGAPVKKGEVLIRLDSRAIEAQIRQAEANVVRSQALLEQAQRDVKRYEQLMINDAGSRLNLENARTAVQTITAQISADQATLDNLRVQLSYYTIAAPVTGRAGVVAVKAGNIAKTGDNSIAFTTINQISPIYVALSIPQRYMAELRASMQQGGAVVHATPQGTDRAVEGRITVIDNAIDQASGTVSVRAEFANADEFLWPGSLCNIRLIFRTEPDVVVVPRDAVQTGQRGNFVFVSEGGVARVKPVTVSRVIDRESVIASGLQGNETVVTDGQLLLTDGMKVEQRGAPAPAAANDPKAGEPKKGAS